MRKLFFLISALLLFKEAGAQFRLDLDEEPKRYYYEYLGRVKKFRDMKDFRDVFHKNKYLLGKKRIMGSISYNTGRVLVDDGRETHDEIRNALGFFTRIRFFEEFSVNTIFYKDFNPKADARWIADYNYSIGRYNWRPHRFNYGYENYNNNKYSDNWNTMKEKFLEGYYFISYNQYSEKLNNHVRFDSTSSLKFIPFVRYSLRYRDENDSVHGKGLTGGKPVVGLAMRYSIFWNIYVESAVYYYFQPKEKQPWDPDYTYGFGYFDWRSFRLSLTYGNWVINRFPWNKQYYPKYDFRDGQFRVILNWMW